MSKEIQASNENKFFMIMKSAINLPGVQINRADFLEKELSKHFTNDVVRLAIQKNPASAGISVKQIEKISRNCINYETNKVTAISAVTGIPGGFAMLGTVPADITQYFAHILRILQKLIYLYGWESIYNSDGGFDDETTNQLTLFVGVMFGVNAANTTVTKLAQCMAVKVEKDLAKKSLTKGTIYPIVKKVADIVGLKMTKKIFARSVGKVVPIIGAGISGGLTYVTFRPSAERLKNYLKNLPTADIEFYKKNNREFKNQNGFIDVEFN